VSVGARGQGRVFRRSDVKAKYRDGGCESGRMRTVPLALAILALSGCLGGGAPATVTTSAPPTDGGVVHGFVVDETGLPVEAAQATFVDAGNLTAASAADGRFRIAGVPPGQHQLVVAKLGYATAQRLLNVADGEEAEVEVTLVAIPKPDLGQTLLLIGKGFLSCSVTSALLTPTLTQPCGWDENNRPLFPFEVDVSRGLVGVVAELVWTPTTAYTGQELRLGLWKNPTCSARCSIEDDVIYGPYVNGPSPLRKAVGNSTEPFKRDLDQTGPTKIAAVALVRDAKLPTENPADASVVWQQPIDFYVSVFYNRDVLVNYTAVPK
jgi:carboxypeptidase family protein